MEKIQTQLFLIRGYRLPDTQDQQKAYDAALMHWHNHRTWRKERDPDRARLRPS